MDKNEKVRVPARGKQLRWIVAAVLLLAVGIYAAWYLIHFRAYNVYQSMITPPAALEESTELSPLDDPEKRIPGFALAAENENVALYYRTDTSEVAVWDKRSGQAAYSNPQDAAGDPVARSGINQENLKSQFILTYLDANAQEGTAWSSYAKATSAGQVSYERIPDGLRVIYTLSSERISLVPDQMTAEWFEKLSGAGKGQVAKFYVPDEESGLYVLKSKGVTTRNRQQIDADVRAGGFTIEDYEEMEALVDAGEEEETESLAFQITLDWHLTGDGVQATLPYHGLQEFGGGQIRSIQLLPFFGAAGSSETGDLVVPAGSGAVIRFNNGKSSSAQYNQNVYDLDLVDADYTATQNTQPARLALFGICRETSGILATCERGATMANIVADVAGRNNSYNYAYFNFTLRRTDTLMVAGEEAVVAERDLYPADCSVRYTLLGEDALGYSGLARTYRNRLIAEGKLTPKDESEGNLPFYYDVIGGVKEIAHWMGVQYLRVIPMTTFSEAEKMVDYFTKNGIYNQRMNLQGWMNGGYYHDPVNRVKVLRQLGGESGLEKLAIRISSSSGRLYPDAAIQFVTNIAKGFYRNAEASRYYAEGYVVDLGVISPISLRRTATFGYSELGYSLLSPKFLPRYAERLKSAADRLKLSGLSLRDLADEVHSDKRRTSVICREADMDLAVRALSLLGENRELMGSGGNDYALPYLKHVLSAPLQATMYPILDAEIPLWEMIVHGSIDYCGSPINMTQSESHTADLLHLIEFGASTRYTFTWKDAAEMKYTGLNSRYATTFDAWKERAAADYLYVNEALRSVSGKTMEEHALLSPTLARVIYSDGTAIYVNRGETDAEADGLTIPALSYLVKGGEAQ